MRQLHIMAEAREREQWNHTSHLMWMLHVVHATQKVSTTPANFNAFTERDKAKANGRSAAKLDPEYVAAFEREMRHIDMKSAAKAAQAAQGQRTGGAS